MGKRDFFETSEACDRACKPVKVPTDEECLALNAMRSIKDRVRVIKKRLHEIASSEGHDNPGEKSHLETEMTRLKREWEEWENKREEAEKKRMILLGHLEEG